MEFNQSKTKENLARAYISECIDGARYQFMAKDAKAKGYGFISNTLKMLAKNEMAHAGVFYNLILCDGKNTKGCEDAGTQNIDCCAGLPFTNYVFPEALRLSGEIEKHESDEVYKEFEETALREGFKEAAKAFHHVLQVENCHHLLLKELYEKAQSGKLYKMNQINKWKCSYCGVEIEQKEAPKTCPLCNYEQGYFNIPLSDG